MGEKGKNYHLKSRENWREVKGDMLRKCGKMMKSYAEIKLVGYIFLPLLVQ